MKKQLNNIVKLLSSVILLSVMGCWSISVAALGFVESKVDDTGGVDGLDGVNAVALSYDDEQVYVTGYYDNAIAVFNRNASDGTLSFSQVIKNNQIGEGLMGVFSVAVAPDDNHVYTLSPTENYLSVFTRAADGTLSIGEVEKVGLNAPATIAFSVDNLRAYVANTGDNSLSAFERDINTGFLTLLQTQSDDTNGVDGLAGASSVVVDDNSEFIYVASKTDHAITLFRRATEELTFVQTYKNGVAGISGLRGAIDIIISPDNQHLYVLGSNNGGIVAFSRNVTTGALTFLENENEEGLIGASALTMNANGTQIYVANTDNSSISVFDRDSDSGLLTFIKSVRDTNNLDGVVDVAVSGNGENVYSAALFANTLGVFTAVSSDLALSIADVPEVTIDSVIDYVMTITNNGPSDATEVVLTDTLPSGTAFSNADPDICALEADTLTCTIGTIAQGASETLTLSVTTPSTVGSGTLTNSASVSGEQADDDTSNNTKTITTALREQLNAIDLSVNIQGLSDPVTMNSSANYTITVNNIGHETAPDVELINTLPTGAVFDSSTPSCTHEATSNTVTCALGDLARGQSTDISMQVTMPPVVEDQALDFSAKVTVSELDEDTGLTNRVTTVTQTVSVTVLALEIELAVLDVLATPSTVSVGTPIAVTVNVSNNGSESVSNVQLNSNLPSQLVLISSESGCTQIANVLTCDIGDMASQASIFLDMVFNTVQSGQVPLTFAISGNGVDSNNANNSASRNITITGDMADISLTIEDNAPVLVNNALIYTVNVTNNGPGVSDVAVTGTITGGNVVVNTISPNDLCNKGRQFSCQFPEMASESTQTITIELTPTEIGIVTLNITADIEADVFDPTLPNTASKETAVSSTEADLRVALSLHPNPALLDNPLIYTAVVENAGAEASNVVLSYTLPLSLEFESAEATQGTCTQANGVVTCSLGPLNTDENATVIITVLPQSLGTVTSTVSVDSDTLDINASNNSDSLDVVVNQNKANISVTMTATPDPVIQGDPIIYTLTIENSGPDMSTGITVTDVLPEGVTFESGTVSPNGSCAEAEGIVTCDIPGLLKDATALVTLSLSPSLVGILTNVVEIVGKEADVDATNNTATVITQVQLQPILFFVEAHEDGVNGVEGLNSPYAITITPNGKQVYVANFAGGAIAIFRRNAESNLIFAGTVKAGDSSLLNASDVAVSPDGDYVYVTHFTDNALSVFSRNAETGTLEFIETLTNGVDGVQGLGNAFSVTATNEHVYVVGVSDNAIAVFSRDAETGYLTFVEIQQDSAALSLEGVDAVTLTPDELYVLATTAIDDSLVIFSRDPTTGRLTLVQTLLNGVNGVLGLDTARAVIVSEDGQYVYVTASGTSGNVLVFKRNIDSGQLTFMELFENGVSGVFGLSGASDLALNPQGNYLYVASIDDSAVAIFSRDVDTGRLTFIDAVINGANNVHGLEGAQGIAISPTGTHLYVIGSADDAVVTLRTTSADLAVSIQDSADPVQVSDNLIYTITVTNAGPDKTNNVVLKTTLSNNLSFQSTAQGNCNFDSTTHVLTCALGRLLKDDARTLTINATAIQAGELNVTATVTADRADSVIENNTATETTESLASADIAVDVRTESDLVDMASAFSYFISVTNLGPQKATGIQVVSELPNTVNIISAQVDTDSEACTVEDNTDNIIVSCFIAQINKAGNNTITITVSANEAGMILNTVAATGDDLDPVPSNNQVNHTVQVALKIIDEMIDNTDNRYTGDVLHSYSISLTGGVNGGDLSGIIINRGLIMNARMLPDTRVNGGKFAGKINNEGRLKNPQLLSWAVIDGGMLQGQITGFPTAPATIKNAIIEANSQLNHVIIGVGTVVDSSVVLGTGVRFERNNEIPQGMNLTTAFPNIKVHNKTAVDLSMDVLLEGDSILKMINALPQVQIDFIQLKTGQLLQANGDKNIVLMPIRVSQKNADASMGMTVHSDGSTTFVTANGRVIFTQPSLQDFLTFQQALNSISFGEFQVQENGNLKAESIVDQSIYGIARPSRETQLVRAISTTTSLATGFVMQGSHAALQFIDSNGTFWHQAIYPVAAYPSELENVLQSIPAVENVVFQANGEISLKVSGLTRTYSLDYMLKRNGSVESRPAQFHYIDDRNGDGVNDARITYSNGDSQVLFLMPLPSLVEDISAIARLQSEGYTVTQKANDDLVFELGETRLQVRATRITQLSENTPTRMDINNDGSMILVTETGLEIVAQPVLQDFSMFQNVLELLGLNNITIRNNGNLTIPVNEHLSFSVRPDVKSTLADENMGFGLSGLIFVPANELSTEAAFVVNEIPWTLIFYDETGAKRQQFIYPASNEPQELLAFLHHVPEIEDAVINNNGTLEEISEGNLIFKGLFGYEVETRGSEASDIQLTTVSDSNNDGVDDFIITYETGEVVDNDATGGIEFMPISDANGDGLDDSLVTYKNGNRQIIYQQVLNAGE